MAGFGMIIGGAMSGWSEGRLGQIKAEREARMKELEEARQDRRIAEDRDFRSKEAAIGRDFDASENDKTRAARAKEFEATQATAGDYGTTAAGETVRIRGDTATTVKGPDGKPVKLAKKDDSSTPAEVSTAEWLIKQGVAKDASDAWRIVRSARNDPEKSRASIYKAWLGVLDNPDMAGQTKDSAEIQSEAMQRTEETLRLLDSADAPPADEGKQSRGRTQDAEEVGTPANVIPSDPAKRVVGKIYINKKGQQARWKGTGWEPVK